MSPSPAWYDADSDDADRHLNRDTIAPHDASVGGLIAALRRHLSVALDRAATLRTERDELRAKVARVEALAGEWIEDSGLDSGFTYADLEKASLAQRTLWEAASDLLAILPEETDLDARRERLADTLYQWNGSTLYGRDLGDFDCDRMKHERGRWLEQADAVLAAFNRKHELEELRADLEKHKRVVDTLNEMVERREKRLAEIEATIRRVDALAVECESQQGQCWNPIFGRRIRAALAAPAPVAPARHDDTQDGAR